jgi:MFS family permease
MRMWVARLFGTAASQMLMVAIGWHMYELTSSAWDLGLVGLYQFVPALLLALLAGHVVDRHHRGRIVAACFAVQGLVALVLLVAVVQRLDTRGLLLGLSLVLGAVRAFQMPAQQALTPLLVPPTMLPRAMAFSSAGMQGAIIGGPALGGLLFVAGMQVPPCSPASISSGSASPCSAPSRSIFLRCCWAARWRCCRSTPRTSCTPGPGGSACCAGRPR